MKAVRAATEQACQENFAGIYVSLQNNPSALANFTKGLVDYAALTPAEKAQFVCSVMAILVYNQNAFDQWRVGHLRADLWAGWESLLINIVHTPGGAAIWRERSYAFTKDFQEEVKRILSRQPHPLAKTFGVVPVSRSAPAEETRTPPV
jgi:hypothetical protein